ncbi:hypothetical protein NLI96_g12522 [Meripilus lineatus]|uniref:Uncharacterized protein n=1 Tax=Meripilus lineatus TaxID=2056292 RepID=A0AAD5UPQ6_9APHY|nr:hypothetical protein NLI96_g12522 [Physisporinus lineatus]
MHPANPGYLKLTGVAWQGGMITPGYFETEVSRTERDSVTEVRQRPRKSARKRQGRRGSKTEERKRGQGDDRGQGWQESRDNEQRSRKRSEVGIVDSEDRSGGGGGGLWTSAPNTTSLMAAASRVLLLRVLILPHPRPIPPSRQASVSDVPFPATLSSPQLPSLPFLDCPRHSLDLRQVPSRFSWFSTSPPLLCFAIGSIHVLSSSPTPIGSSTLPSDCTGVPSTSDFSSSLSYPLLSLFLQYRVWVYWMGDGCRAGLIGVY